MRAQSEFLRIGFLAMSVALVGFIGSPAAAALTFFSDPAAFSGSCSGLPLEDFNNTNAPPNRSTVCSTSINSSSNDACYSPGALIDGFTLTGQVALVVVMPVVRGVTSAVVGPGSFAANSEISFSGGGVVGVGMDLLGPYLPGVTVTVEIFGAGNVLLGTTTATLAAPPGQFFGVTSDQPIERIAFSSGIGEFIDNLEFGDCAAEVEIDIKPGSDPNSVHPGTPGVIPVAILGSESFDVADVDPTTLAFGPDGAALAHAIGLHFSDVNDDGFIDLLGHYRADETGIAYGDTEACLSGELFDATPFEACDDIRTVPPGCGLGFEVGLVLLPLSAVMRRRRRRA